MSFSFCQFQHPGDGWASALEPWLAESASRVLHGHDVWLITPGRLAAHWIRNRWAATGRPWFGVRSLEPWSLRRELAARLGQPCQPLGRESLELLLTVLANGDLSSDPLARRIATSPGAALRALDELGRAGWHSSDSALAPTRLGPWLAALETTEGWLPALDTHLAATPRSGESRPLHVFFWGWDSEQSGNWKLLLAALRQATTASIAAPAPRFDGRDTEQAWLDFLSRNFRQNPEVCPAAPGQTVPPPDPYPLPTVSPSTAADAVLALLRESIQAGRRSAILIESNSPLGPVVRTRLRELAIPFYDDLGTPRPPNHFWAARRAWIRHHTAEGSLPTFVQLWADLVNGLGLKNLATPTFLERALRRVFAAAQTTRLSNLLQHPAANSLRKIIEPLAPHLEPWPAALTWDETAARLIAFDQAIGADPAELEPLVGRLRRLLGNRQLARADLLRFLEQGLTDSGVLRGDHENNPFVPLTLTTRRAALHQTWDALIFTDANEGVWPCAPSENPFLPDSVRIQLNQAAPESIARLATFRDRAASERDQTSRLIDTCTSQVALVFLTRDPSEPQSGLFPNELAARWANGRAPATRPLPPPQPAQPPPAELAVFARVHASRRSPEAPPDRWFWHLGPLPDDLPPWNPSALDRIRHGPATFFLNWFYQAERTWGKSWERAPRAAVGTLAHLWLAAALQGTRSPTEADLVTRLTAARAETSSNAPADPWWQGVLAEAWHCSRSMVAAIPELANGFSLKTEVPVSSGSVDRTGLALSGKVDLLLEQNDGQHLRIIDFKTGTDNPPHVKKIADPKGTGLQFAAYLWLFHQQTKVIEVGMVDGNGEWHLILSEGDASTLLPTLEALARVRKEGQFGQGAFAGEFSPMGENLPFACPDFDKSLLEKKQLAMASITPSD